MSLQIIVSTFFDSISLNPPRQSLSEIVDSLNFKWCQSTKKRKISHECHEWARMKRLKIIGMISLDFDNPCVLTKGVTRGWLRNKHNFAVHPKGTCFAAKCPWGTALRCSPRRSTYEKVRLAPRALRCLELELISKPSQGAGKIEITLKLNVISRLNCQKGWYVISGHCLCSSVAK